MNKVYWMPKTTDEDLKRVGAISLPANRPLNLTQFRLSFQGKIMRLVNKADDPVQALRDLVSRLESAGLLDAQLPPLPKTEAELDRELFPIVQLIVETSPNLDDRLGRIETPRVPVQNNLTAEHLEKSLSLEQFLDSLERL